MRITTWNCNGAFRRKFGYIADLRSDIAIVQECEDPIKAGGEYKEWAENYIWIGTNKNKGLGVFAKKHVILRKLDWHDSALELFIPCAVNESFKLLAVWTQHAKSQPYRYIGQLWKYLQVHKQALSEGDCVICGDFNSNSIWDKEHRGSSHTDVVRELAAIDVTSLYHLMSTEEHGNETAPTFFMHRNTQKPYHIDYAFASQKLVKENSDVTIGRNSPWLTHSDHMPLTFEITV